MRQCSFLPCLTEICAERSRKTQDIFPDTPCLFKADGADDGDLENFDLGGGLSVGIEEDFSETIFETAASGQQIKFWPWVNQVHAYFMMCFGSCAYLY
jgi:chloride channel 3/4/5